MKHLSLFIFAALMCAAGAAIAGQGADDRVVRVFVHVDANGKVAAVEPAVELKTELKTALRATLDRLITKPAVVDGKAVASQFVMDLAIKTAARSGGDFTATFQYLSSQAVPSGSWRWVRRAGRQPVLVPSDATKFRHTVSTLPQRAQDPPYYGLH